MSDISTLLKEAKPLYFKRKKQRKQIKTVVGFIGCLVLGLVLIGKPYQVSHSVSNLDGLYSFLYDDVSYQQLFTEVDTVLVDEFGSDEQLWEQVI